MGFPALWQGWIWCERQIFSHFHSYATQNLTSKNFVSFSGTIDSEEMTEIITNLCSLEGLTQVGGVNNFDLFDKYDLWGVYYVHVCWCLLTIVGPNNGDTLRRQFCLSRVKIETWTVKLVALLGLAYLSNVQALILFLTYFVAICTDSNQEIWK